MSTTFWDRIDQLKVAENKGDQNMNGQFIKRLKSFLWRGGMIAVIAFIDYVLTNIGILDLPIWAVGLIGLIGGEITKFLNR